jgi:ABC-type sugar transport system ATPase subunit
MLALTFRRLGWPQEERRMSEPGGAAKPGPDYRARAVSKSFAHVTVLHEIDVHLRPGEIHALIGENGAGKSTLLKIMAGMYPPDSGILELADQTLPALTPRDAQRRGIYLVPQEPRLMPDLSVAENLYLGAWPRGRFGRVGWRAMNDTTSGLLAEVGLQVNPRAQAGGLSLAQQQLLECARALSRGCTVIFFDEPTSPLTAHETEKLFRLMDRMRGRGLTLAFISHRLDEIEAVSDQITVLRDGEVVASQARGEASREELVRAMIGRTLGTGRRVEQAAGEPGAIMLEGSDIVAPPKVHGMSVQVRAGEIVGLAGLVGSGRTEFAEALFGIRPLASGTVRVCGRDITGSAPRACIDAGLVYLAEDRGRSGIFAEVDIARNGTSAILPRLPRVARVFTRPRKEQELARDGMRRTDVRAPALAAPIKTLSGGNQQKALLARWMLAAPQVAIFDEPTRGVDVGAKESIYEIIESLAAAGLAALVISSELQELVRLCHRICVVYEGRIVGELAGPEATVEALGQLALGAA